MSPYLRDFLGVEPTDWQMSPGERLALVGFLELLKPATALEIGYYHGGSARWLSAYAGQLLTVDIDARVLEAPQRFPRTEAWCLSSAEAFARLQRDGRHFDVCLIDADHSTTGATADLAAAIPLADVILLHDTGHPPCRAGYLAALAGKDVYADLDVVDGRIQIDGLYGGLGVVVPGLPRNTPSRLTEKIVNFIWLEKQFRAQSQKPSVRVPLRQMVKNWLRPGWHALRHHLRPPPSHPAFIEVSETSKCRARLEPFCQGTGLDIGPGGDPITLSALRVDLPTPYSQVGHLPVQLTGTATDLRWFGDGTLDYVYSSHVLEDFVDTTALLREWLRVLKPGGFLVLYCPDEQRFRAHCTATGQPYNPAHKLPHFSLTWVKDCLAQLGESDFPHELPQAEIYSWDLVVRRSNRPMLPPPSHVAG